ncbi:uncharacterized protein N7511_010356 [Penicillium nucicola]|uniref:uncharacterized protein n=1 Tax=Penicillium nucicola TaxID=1850975 RepID=UPI0025458FA0|nr:uncharacterized protein N7511_010356 [Penicillium nucicola]KAJ5748660.1 hypothetical protein N7511_010356 [Penicillium nucicola]
MDDQDPAAETLAPKKRTRVQFSCTACRFRKLKCCRNHPCTNCKKRGEAAACTYVGRGPRGKAHHGQSSPTLVQDRLHHLENLVMSLAQKQQPEDEFEIDFNAPPGSRGAYVTPSPASDRDAISTSVDTGTLFVKNEGTSYIDSANWRAILEEINGVREYLDQNGADSDDEGLEDDPYESSSPILLFGSSRPITKEEMLVDIPPRSIADRLISRFLKTTEPALVAIHVPTFQKEYEQFWQNPSEASFTWISLLYSMMALSVSMYHRSAEPLPIDMSTPTTALSTFRKRSSQCLIKANYINPGRYKAQALFFYTLSEFYRSQDAQIGVSYLLGMALRLAMRMGYHRDSHHYPMLSAWEGEMRRRLWAVLVQLDTLISFQVGVPRTIQPWQYDTELPANLLDSDFDENSTQLPPSRPEDQRTASSYTRAKSHIMKVFGQITDLAFSREPSSYDEILEIDRRLQTSRDMSPLFLRMKPMTQSIADPTEVIMRRYTLELLYQKARVVLHRRYIGETNPKFAYSRSVCLTAARETLRHHAEIWSESMPGGQLYAERYFLNSLSNSDFVLSAMILCLGLSQDEDRGGAARLGEQERADFVVLLETTHRIFLESQHHSVDTQRAVTALTIMLSRVKDSRVQHPRTNTNQIMPAIHNFTPPQSHGQSVLDRHVQTFPAVAEVPNQMHIPDQTPAYNSLGVIGDMLNLPAQLDWRLYDSRISGIEMATNDNVWYSASSPAPAFDFGSLSSGVSPMDHPNYQV